MANSSARRPVGTTTIRHSAREELELVIDPEICDAVHRLADGKLERVPEIYRELFRLGIEGLASR